MVMDQDHPFCAYGALTFELTIINPDGDPVWYLNESPDGCCPFESKAPNNPIVHSSIYWDGTINTGFANFPGEEASATTYYYVLHLWGCNGSVTYTGYIQIFRAPTNPPQGLLSSYDQADAELASFGHAEVQGSAAIGTAILFPNPSRDLVTLKHPAGVGGLRVFDMLGRPMFQSEGLSLPQLTLSVSDWSAGEYVFRVLPVSGSVEYIRFTKH